MFSQLMDFLPVHQFRQWVERYGGNYKIQSFTCLDQFLCLAFAQLAIQVFDVDMELAKRGASLKAQHNLPYADCVAAALAQARKATPHTSQEARRVRDPRRFGPADADDAYVRRLPICTSSLPQSPRDTIHSSGCRRGPAIAFSHAKL